MAEDPYQRLGVSRNATPDAIRRAYRQRAKQAHPDAGGSSAEMARLSEAYDQVSRSEPPAPSIFRAPRRDPLPPRRYVTWSAEAERFASQTLRPQERLLRLSLDRLAIEVTAWRRDPSRGEQVRDVAAQVEVALSMTGSRLARLPWPEELDAARTLWGEALRHLSDAVLELQWGQDASRGLDEGRDKLRAAMAALPG